MYITAINFIPVAKRVNKKDLLIETFIVALAVFLTLTQTVDAANPSTGLAKLDSGMWKIVKVFQSAIFWLSMIYSFRAMLELVIKGDGSWKKVGVGFTICAADYLIPWIFTIIRDSFVA
jgi:hypothetical protein